MRLLVLIALCALVCREAAAQTVEEVMDAFAFAFRGVEADAPLDVSKPVKRSVHTAHHL